MEKLGLYKIDPERPTLKKATEGSACFDVSYWPTKLNNPSTVGFQGYIYEAVTGYDDNNKPLKRLIDNVTGSIIIMPNERLLIPTSIIMDIPTGYSVRIHPRSGFSFKTGCNLINGEGVIDWDYIDEVYIPLVNNSDQRVRIEPGERIAQAELVQMVDYKTTNKKLPPEKKTDREGGLGSTGTK